MSKKVLITGGNKGIGLAVSRAMLEFGYEIIIVARDFDTCPLVGVANVTCIEYDLSNVDGLPELVKEVGDIDFFYYDERLHIVYEEEEFVISYMILIIFLFLFGLRIIFLYI